MYECQKCAAQHDNNNTGRCLLAGDSGNICGGRLEAISAKVRGLSKELFPRPEDGATLPEILGRATMRRGGRFVDGRAIATLTFSSENDRAEFAAIVLQHGGGVTA